MCVIHSTPINKDSLNTNKHKRNTICAKIEHKSKIINQILKKLQRCTAH